MISLESSFQFMLRWWENDFSELLVFFFLAFACHSNDKFFENKFILLKCYSHFGGIKSVTLRKFKGHLNFKMITMSS